MVAMAQGGRPSDVGVRPRTAVETRISSKSSASDSAMQWPATILMNHMSIVDVGIFVRQWCKLDDAGKGGSATVQEVDDEAGTGGYEGADSKNDVLLLRDRLGKLQASLL
jgi:hypothetical protein